VIARERSRSIPYSWIRRAVAGIGLTIRSGIDNDVEADEMSTTLRMAAESYVRAKALSRGTCNEYLSTLRKWEVWGRG
jgi:hypothetical protein